MTYRYYSSTAGEMLLQSSITDSDTSLIVDTVAGLPTSFPYTLILDYGTASEEVVDVSNAVGTTLTIARGKDSTVAQAHTAGAVIRHGVTARDHRESRDHEAATVAHGVTGDVVGTSDTQTLEKKTFLPSADHVAFTLQGRAGNTEPIAEIQDSAGAVQFQVYDDEIYATDGAGTRWWGIRGGAAATFWGRFFDLVVTGTKVAIGATKQVGATGKFLQLVDTDGTTELFSVDADGKATAAGGVAGSNLSMTGTGTFGGAIASPTITSLQNADTTEATARAAVSTRVTALEARKVQHGTATIPFAGTTTESVTVNFPTAFPGTPTVVATSENVGINISVAGRTSTQVVIYGRRIEDGATQGSSVTVDWVAFYN